MRTTNYRKFISNLITFIVGLILFSTLSYACGAVLANEHIRTHITDGSEAKPEIKIVEITEPQISWYYEPVYYDASYYVIPQNDVKIPVSIACSEDELELLIRVIYLEAGAESDICIRCCTDVAFNQLQSGLFGNTLMEVLYRPGNYDETVWNAWTKEPSDRVREIVMDVYTNGISLPARIVYYRNTYFHTFRYSIPEFTTDNVYFSSSSWLQ